MEKINKFFNSIYLPIILSIITIITWKYDLFFIILIVNAILASLITKFKGNPLMMLLITMSTLMGYQSSMSGYNNILVIISIISVAFAIIYILYDVLKSKINLKNLLIYTFSAFLISGLISFVNTPTISVSLLVLGRFAFSGAMLLYMISKTKYTDKNKDYFVKIMLCMSFIIIFEMIIKYFQIYDIENPYEVIRRKQIHLGWTLGNRYVCILAMGLLSTFYSFISKEKNNLIYGLFAILQVIAIIVCLSRGAILGLGFAAIPLLLCLFIFAENKKQANINLLMLCAMVVITVVLMLRVEVFNKLILELFQTDYTDDNGRNPLLELSYNQFKLNWFIGNGIGTSRYYILELLNWNLTHYHNFILQTLAEQGILGFITFSSFIITCFIKLFKKDLFKIIVLCILLYLIGHGLVDTTFHSYLILPIFMAMIGFIGAKED